LDFIASSKVPKCCVTSRIILSEHHFNTAKASVTVCFSMSTLLALCVVPMRD
jgi:hypothetical protein